MLVPLAWMTAGVLSSCRSEREDGTAAVGYSGSRLLQAIRSGSVPRDLLPWRCVRFDSGNDPIVNEKLGILLMERHFLEIEEENK